jgi:hypothetical protein
VINLRGERGIDAAQRLARGHAAGSRGENLAVVRLRGVDAIAGENLFADFSDKPV